MLNELINKLNEAMQAIQSLQIQPTEHNCRQIVSALDAIRAAADQASQMNRKIPPETDDVEITAVDPADDRDEN